MACQIFISYRRDTGVNIAQSIALQLRLAGYEVFFDGFSIRSGDFTESIETALRECQDVIVLLTPGSLDRCVTEEEKDFVKREIALALALGKNIVPLMSKDFSFPEKLPDEIEKLRFLQAGDSIDFSKPQAIEQNLLFRIAKGYFKSKSKADEEAEAEEVEKPAKSKPKKSAEQEPEEEFEEEPEESAPTSTSAGTSTRGDDGNVVNSNGGNIQPTNYTPPPVIVVTAPAPQPTPQPQPSTTSTQSTSDSSSESGFLSRIVQGLVTLAVLGAAAYFGFKYLNEQSGTSNTATVAETAPAGTQNGAAGTVSAGTKTATTGTVSTGTTFAGTTVAAASPLPKAEDLDFTDFKRYGENAKALSDFCQSRCFKKGWVPLEELSQKAVDLVVKYDKVKSLDPEGAQEIVEQVRQIQLEAMLIQEKVKDAYLGKKDPNQVEYYTVVPGDSLAKIAAKLGVTEDELKAANPEIKDWRMGLKRGQKLVVPAKKSK